jgi:hypothetical protein
MRKDSRKIMEKDGTKKHPKIETSTIALKK